MSQIPQIERVDLTSFQATSDILREGANLVATRDPTTAKVITIACDAIEALCDVIKSQEVMASAMRDCLIAIEKGMK